MQADSAVKEIAVNYNIKAIIWVLAGTGIFSLIFTSGRLLEGADWVWQIIFFRYLSGFVLMLAIAKQQKVALTVSAKWSTHLARALFGGAGGCAAIYAAANMPVASAAAIGLLDSVFAVVLGIFVFGELVGSKRWLAIFGCLVGAAVVLFDKGAFQGSAFLSAPAIVALLGALFLALESVFIRALATSENVVSILLHVNFFGMLIFAVPAIYVWDMTDIYIKLLLCLLGPLALIGQYCNIRGYRLAGLSIVAPVGYSWIIFAMMIDYVLFATSASYVALIGAALILASGYLLARTPERV